MPQILMPKATAVWLIDNTSLTFEQVAAFCELHPLEVKGIADGDVASTVRGADPITNGQLTRDEIERAEADPSYQLQLKGNITDDLVKKKKTRRYTPLSLRQERPNAIAWMIKNHPEVSTRQIEKLLSTTKTTIESVRNRTHWNASNIQPQDPVALGLCSQIELDEVVATAAAKRRKADAEAGLQTPEGEGLRPLDEAVVGEPETPDVFAQDHSDEGQGDRREELTAETAFSLDPEPEPEEPEDDAPDPNSVFASLANLKVGGSSDSEDSQS